MIQMRVNGALVQVAAPPLTRLLDALREELRLTGTKEGCGEGECGSCSVLVDGEVINSCLMVVGQCQGRDIVTVEGLGNRQRLTPLQQCFIDHGGAQCGICTPGMLVAAQALLKKHPHPTEAEVREGLAGNLCRCTGYQRIVDAVMQAASLEAEGGTL